MKYFFFLLSFLMFLLVTNTSIAQNKSLYSALFDQEEMLQIEISTDVGRLIKKSMKEEYQEAFITIKSAEENVLMSLPGRVRARGNMRKQVCRFPPIKIDFNKGDLDSLGYNKKVDKLKLVFPCKDRDLDEQKMFKELLVYELYNVIDSNCLRAKIVDVTFKDENEEKSHFRGLLLEDEEAYVNRTGATIVESGKLMSGSFDRGLFLKMSFFQYMIANTDYSIYDFHNLEIVKLPQIKRVVAIPYDFDYSGFVGHSYAVPHEALPIKSVHERYMHKFPLKGEEFDETVKYYLSIEDDIFSACDKATYMNEKTLKSCKLYLEKFFTILKSPKRLKAEMVTK